MVLRISVQEGFNDLPPIAQLQEFYTKALARENIKPHFLALPLARSAQLADNGEIDGEMIRSLNIIEKYPNLIATSKPIGFSNFLILYAKSNRSFKEKKLPQYKGLIILNSFTTRQKARDMRLRLDAVPTIDQGLSMVVAGRADYIILAEPIIDSLPRSLKPLMDQLKTVKEPFSRVPLYFILNKKHKDLMPKLEKALFKTMSTEGHNYRYLKDFLNTGA
ncbi:MAG: transporter substrate-binding domain-containing protein [Bdellovibrio sp.]|nr:transporter substrate-binding domain-containing protein [Bdellovibrio sp.]